MTPGKEGTGGSVDAGRQEEASLDVRTNATPDDFPRDVVPAGRYAGGGRSPVVWVHLCAGCAGFAPHTDQDYRGALSGTCQGCGTNTRELHRFQAWIDTARGCRCSSDHPQVLGDVHTPGCDS